MSIIDDISSLEQRVQDTLDGAYDNPAITNFREEYVQTILRGLPDDLSKAGEVDLENVIRQSLDDAGINLSDELQDAIESDVNGILDDVATFYEGTTGKAMPNLLDAASEMEQFQELRQSFRSNMGSMREGLFNQTLEAMEDAISGGGLNRSTLLNTISEAAEGQLHYARTNTRMIIGGYNRMGREMARREAELKHGYYYGSIRSNTRFFCRSCIGKTFSMEQIQSLSNGQGLDVKIYCGGWNCIHSWTWVDPEWDNELKNAQVNSDIGKQHVDDESLDVAVPG